jgi:hypothetical protein
MAFFRDSEGNLVALAGRSGAGEGMHTGGVVG